MKLADNGWIDEWDDPRERHDFLIGMHHGRSGMEPYYHGPWPEAYELGYEIGESFRLSGPSYTLH